MTSAMMSKYDQSTKQRRGSSSSSSHRSSNALHCTHHADNLTCTKPAIHLVLGRLFALPTVDPRLGLRHDLRASQSGTVCVKHELNGCFAASTTTCDDKLRVRSVLLGRFLFGFLLFFLAYLWPAKGSHSRHGRQGSGVPTTDNRQQAAR